MPTDHEEPKRAIVRRELGGHGLAFHVSTAREGGNLVARIQVTDAATEKVIAKLVTVVPSENLDFVVGVDATEGVARDFLAQLFGVAHALGDLVPAVTIEEE